MSARQLFAVDGLWCGGCARGLENRLRAQPGVQQVAVHFLTASALIQWDPARTDRAGIAAVIAGAGYRLVEQPRPAAILERLETTITALSIRLAVAVFFGMWSMVGSVMLYVGVADPRQAWWVAVATGVAALPVLAWAGSDILRMAVRSVRLRSPGIDLMIGLGVTGSTLLSVINLWQGGSHVYFDTATMLVTLLLAGRLIEAWVRRRALDAIVAMQAADNETALVLEPAGAARPVPVGEVPLGSQVLVPAGAVASVDGVVLQGEARLDTSILTGESRPQAAAPGTRISAGSINLDRALTVRSDREPGDRDLDRMGGRIALEMVARQPATDSQTRISELLGRWVPVLALLVGVAALLAGLGVEESTLRALAVLVAACPCALAVATPLAHLHAAILASRHGLRIADPGSLAPLARARTAVFDKTGTLTMGEPAVVEAVPAAGWHREELLEAAAAAEAGIDHPLARAIVAAAPAVPDADAAGERSPRAAQGSWRAHRVRVATADPDALASAGRHPDEGLTWLAVQLDGKPMGYLGLADRLDPEAASTIGLLQRAGFDVWLASGDAEGPVHALAGQVGVVPARARAGMSPAQKADLLRELPGPVVFVGDGINDAPAMAAAACGISVARAHPSTQATAAIGILDGGIGGVLRAATLARWSVGLVRRNLWAALAYNAAILSLAIFGVLTPLGAALAMTASSLTQIGLVLGSRPRLGPPRRARPAAAPPAGEPARAQ
ncbi:cation-translocating P-type ATPase [Stenotrophomonas maltophilia]|uniref:Cation-translocating P-type ATPase n=1 Tax=Stenotrophomonas maltophilia TaxID=40324 RepID=A0AAI9C1K2_STEMA|nr:cation-translocating P-type ATPase [Stenotrophomonas maltophilia]